MLAPKIPGIFLRKDTLLLTLAITLCSFSSASAANTPQETDKLLGFHMAIETALSNDPWLVSNKHSQDAIQSMSIAAGSLPDPKMSIDVANLPTNSFDFGQEAMTQFKVGVSQSFPAGDSRKIKRQQLELQSAEFPFLRQDRKAKVTVTVGQLWLNIYIAQESIALIEKNKALFEQLADVAQSSYASALGKSRQQNVIRAQLELTRLEDRLTILHQRQEMYQKQLSEWLTGSLESNDSPKFHNLYGPYVADFTLVRKLPELSLLDPEIAKIAQDVTAEVPSQATLEKLSHHPTIRALDQRILVSNSAIDLARQKYSPEWGVRAGYGYRGTDPLGNNRADLFSVGVTFSVPLFTANRQDKEVQSARSRTSAVKTEKWQLLRKLMASFETSMAQLRRLNERHQLYQTRLLPQIHEQAEASLTAYTNDDGDFAEAVRARIAEVDAEINALTINVERQKTILQLNYFLTAAQDDTILDDQIPGYMK